MFFRKRPDAPENFAPRAPAQLRKKIREANPSGDVTVVKEEFFTASVWQGGKSRFDDGDGLGKCGYCERQRDIDGECQVDHYRPRTAVAGFETAPRFDGERPKIVRRTIGYWWLAYEWSNYVVICPACNGRKSALFPVQSPVSMTDRADLSGESPWLLDPHDTDERGKAHFRWTESGMIEPLARNSRAEWTIVICDLNRKGLVTSRTKKIVAVIRALEAYDGAMRAAAASHRQNNGRAEQSFLDELDTRTEDLLALGASSAEYTGLVRSWVDREIAKRRLPPIDWDSSE